MSQAFQQITLVSVTGLADARGAARALQHSLAQMPGARAVLCSSAKPDDLAPGIVFQAVAPMNYHEYIGAPIHLARVVTPEGMRWVN